ncbi:hypothetical protein [Streptomyces sp. NPDC046909]|uniref:hypothetical protein n=1 Tax=Streptomyces sp. NPDC046909 TaxID=3155617 RepID=UPI0033E7E8BA
MSALCNHRRADHHHDGETCRYARELQPGDKISILSGCLAEVLDAHPAESDGWMSVLLDVSWDGATLIACDTILAVRPANGLRPDELPAPEPGTEVRVRVEVTEEVLYEDDVVLTVPVSATADDTALLIYLSTHWEDYNDVIENGASVVNEQTITSARIVQKEASA